MLVFYLVVSLKLFYSALVLLLPFFIKSNFGSNFELLTIECYYNYMFVIFCPLLVVLGINYCSTGATFSVPLYVRLKVIAYAR